MVLYPNKISSATVCKIPNDYSLSQTYPQQNDVIRRYTEQLILSILFLPTETDHRVTRK